MNEKERIIDLVKQNIISMDEALDLLEAAGHKEVQDPNVNESVETTTNTTNENNDVDTEPAAGTDEDTKQSATKTEKQEKDAKIFVDEMLDSGFEYARNISDYFTKEFKTSKTNKDTDQATDYYANEYKEAQADAENTADQQDNTSAKKAREAVSQRLAEIKTESLEIDQQLTKKQEALTIAQQRKRELEIFAELDDLSDEMAEQANKLALRQTELTNEIAELEAKLESLKTEQNHLYKTHTSEYRAEFKQFINDNAERYGHSAREFGSGVAKEGKHFGKAMKRNVNDFLKNFNMKEVDFSFQVPWVKTEKIEHRFTYAGENIDFIDININNGSLDVQAHDSDEIILDSQIRFHGDHDEISLDQFMKLSTVSVDEKKFIFHVTTPRISTDATLYVPKRLMNYAKYTLVNGDLSLTDLILKDGQLNNKNGDITLNNIKGEMVQVESFNGDIVVSDSAIQSVDVKNVNGDIRLSNDVNDLVIDTVNSDCYITKTNATPSNMRISAVTGNVKVSVPINANIDGYVESSHGELKERMADIIFDDVEASGKHHIHRHSENNVTQIQFDVKLTSGDVYLKDNLEVK